MSIEFIAQIFGPILVVFGLVDIISRKEMDKITNSLKSNPALMYLGSFIAMIIGLAVVNSYSSWTNDWRVFITLFGWVVLVRGVLGVFMPQTLIKMAKKHHFIPLFIGIVRLFFGIIFVLMGYN